jgi:tetratricopeptide (TPR) repeat protein
LPLTREIGARSLEIRALLAVGCMTHALGESEEALPHVEEGLALARESGEPYVEAYALTHLGHVLGTLGNQDQARAAYEQAMALRREMHQEAEATEAQAGLARLLLAGDDSARAMGYVEDILHYLESGTLERAEQPLLVYLTCYRVLQTTGDARAAAVLEEGYRLLQEIAGKITDQDLRRSFLENVTANREIAEEHKRLCGA